jgi:hypothetical protein
MQKKDEGCSCSSVLLFMGLVLSCILFSKFTVWFEQTPFWAVLSRIILIGLLILVVISIIAMIIAWWIHRHDPAPSPSEEEDDDSWMYRSRPWYY